MAAHRKPESYSPISGATIDRIAAPAHMPQSCARAESGVRCTPYRLSAPLWSAEGKGTDSKSQARNSKQMQNPNVPRMEALLLLACKAINAIGSGRRPGWVHRRLIKPWIPAFAGMTEAWRTVVPVPEREVPCEPILTPMSAWAGDLPILRATSDVLRPR